MIYMILKNKRVIQNNYFKAAALEMISKFPRGFLSKKLSDVITRASYITLSLSLGLAGA